MTPLIAARPNRGPFVRGGRHRSTRPRTLNLIDLENLVGGHVHAHFVRTTWSEYRAVIGARHSDHSTVAVSRKNAAEAFFALPANVHRVIGADGPDGADLALIDSVDDGWITANFGQVVIGSGDHIFGHWLSGFAPRACR